MKLGVFTKPRIELKPVPYNGGTFKPYSQGTQSYDTFMPLVSNAITAPPTTTTTAASAMSSFFWFLSMNISVLERDASMSCNLSCLGAVFSAMCFVKN